MLTAYTCITRPEGQSVVSLIVDPEPIRSILTWPYTSVEFDDDIFSTIILPLTQEGLCQLQAKVCTRGTGKPLSQAWPGKV